METSANIRHSEMSDQSFIEPLDTNSAHKLQFQTSSSTSAFIETSISTAESGHKGNYLPDTGTAEGQFPLSPFHSREVVINICRLTDVVFSMSRPGTEVFSIAIMGVALGLNLLGQDAILPQFDVAVVKAVKEPEPGGYRHQFTPQGVTMHAVSMGYCIRLAYGLSSQRPWELIGPSWIDPPTEFIYDISAKTDNPTSEDQIKRMLQTLLAGHFKLIVHRENRRLPAYALTRTSVPPCFNHRNPIEPGRYSRVQSLTSCSSST